MLREASHRAEDSLIRLSDMYRWRWLASGNDYALGDPCPLLLVRIYPGGSGTVVGETGSVDQKLIDGFTPAQEAGTPASLVFDQMYWDHHLMKDPALAGPQHGLRLAHPLKMCNTAEEESQKSVQSSDW